MLKWKKGESEENIGVFQSKLNICIKNLLKAIQLGLKKLTVLIIPKQR